MTKPIDRVIDAIRAAGTGSKIDFNREANRYQCKCPAHDDKQASLSVSEDRDGKVLIHCHAGCDTSDILKVIGLNYEALFPKKENYDKPIVAKQTIEATYDYYDENGVWLYQAVRFQNPKKFLQRTRDEKGAYTWKLGDVRRVIYKLPQVIQAVKDEKIIFIVEGEKDVDNLFKLGLVGTSSPMGAGKWKPEYNPPFTNANVVIIPDNDKSGVDHAIQVSSELLPLAKSIRVLKLDLGEFGNKKDLTDWLNIPGNTKDKLVELAFEAKEFKHGDEPDIHNIFGLVDNSDIDENEPNTDDNFWIEDYCINFIDSDSTKYVITDYSIDIISHVHDDLRGQLFYIKIKEKLRGRVLTTEAIEIPPETLDDVRAYSKQIRPYSTGEIFQYKEIKTRPIKIFKWLLKKFEKPMVRRPDHVGFIKDKSGRPFWIFGNAIICPPYKNFKGMIVKQNDEGEFIIDKHTGFTLPLYKDKHEMESLVPIVNTDMNDIENFIQEVKYNYLSLVGGGDASGDSIQFAKLMLGFVFYHLFDNDLYYANDINGHTVMLYVYGQRGSGKTTYFNTILRAFYGLHRTKDIKNDVSVVGLENTMGMYASLPVGYDEYNPETAKVGLTHINGYYHKTSRTVSDIERAGRNKSTPIRSTLAITSNFRINLDIDQADATESRVIYYQYKKEYRGKNPEFFKFFQDNMDNLSRVTAYFITKQTDEHRAQMKAKAEALFQEMCGMVDGYIKDSNRNDEFDVEHRLTDNYTRIYAVYQTVFGDDPKVKVWIFEELLRRFKDSKTSRKENLLYNQLAYLTSDGRIKHCMHYFYAEKAKELYVHVDTLYETYQEYKREKSLTKLTFKENMQDFFDSFGGFTIATKKWYGKYYDRNHEPVNVNIAKHSYILKVEQVRNPNNAILQEMFPPPDELLRTWEELDRRQQTFLPPEIGNF